MKAVVLTIVVALALVGGATAGGPHLRELVERVGLLEAGDVEHEAEIVELERRVLGLELVSVRNAGLEARVRKLRTRLGRVELCTLRRAVVVRPIPGRSPFSHCRWFKRSRRGD